MPKNEYSECKLCARTCGVDRNEAVGYCNMSADTYVSYYSLHRWEEPPISGERGSGTIFFDGCSLGCVFCQNAKISRGGNGVSLDDTQLASIMLELQSAGAHNINFVTPTHFSPAIASGIKAARASGLCVPTVYNTGSYDSVDALKRLDGLIDIYMPDLKYYKADTAKKYSNAADYPVVARAAISEMFRQVGPVELDENGFMKRGVIVRILLLPGHVAEAKLSLKYVYNTYGDKVYVSLMNQYTPMPDMKPPLNRKVTRDEYRSLVDYAERLGVINAFIQEWGTAEESFIPPFGDEKNICGIKKER